MTPMELEERLEDIDAIFAAALQSGHEDATFEKIFEAVKTISYLQSIHMMHYALELLDDHEEEDF